MRTKARYNIIIFLVALFLFACLFVGAGTPATKASAIEGAIEGAIGGAGEGAGESTIDYTALEYIDIPVGVDYKTEKVVVRIHCPSIRHIGDEEGYIEGFKNFVSFLSFYMGAGGQIYFVDGVACDMEDAESSDNVTDKFAEYYEIKYYDDEDKYVYITFKNLTELVKEESGAYDNGVWIRSSKDETYTEKAKLAYLPEDPTEAPKEDPMEDEKDKQGLFAWVEWWHILIAVYVLAGIVVGIIWTTKK